LLALYQVSLFTRILLVVAVLLPNTILAQPAKQTNQDSVVETLDNSNKARDVIMKCAEAVARVKKLEEQIQAWKIVDDKFIGPLGGALTIVQASTDIGKGQPVQAIQTAGMALVDSAFCKAQPHLCPAWMIGRTAGEVISNAPKLFGFDETVNEVWTDFLASWAYPDPTPADLQKLFDLARQKQRELRALMKSQQREKVRCEASEDALDNDLKNAAASVGRHATQKALQQGQQSPSALQQQGLGGRASQQGDAFSNAASGVLHDTVRQSVQGGISNVQFTLPSHPKQRATAPGAHTTPVGSMPPPQQGNQSVRPPSQDNRTYPVNDIMKSN
jgi:hypothetical protein